MVFLNNKALLCLSYAKKEAGWWTGQADRTTCTTSPFFPDNKNLISCKVRWVQAQIAQNSTSASLIAFQLMSLKTWLIIFFARFSRRQSVLKNFWGLNPAQRGFVAAGFFAGLAWRQQMLPQLFRICQTLRVFVLVASRTLVSATHRVETVDKHKKLVRQRNAAAGAAFRPKCLSPHFLMNLAKTFQSELSNS